MRYSKQLVPNILLSIFLLTSLIYGILWNIHPIEGALVFGMNYHQIGGIIAVIINYLVYIKKKRLYKYSILLTLLLGLTNFLIFTPFDGYSTLTLGRLPMRFQNISFLLIVLVYVLNFKRTNDFILAQIRPSDEVIERKNRESIYRFKSRFKQFDMQTLLSISNSPEYDHFAKLGALELIKERNSSDENLK